jgi:hypothetical protein
MKLDEMTPEQKAAISVFLAEVALKLKDAEG